MRYQQICPVSLASEVIAERWTPLILREIVLFDRHHFSEIQHGVGRISQSLLSARLPTLESAGVIERRPNRLGRGWEYHPTRAGRELETVLNELGIWAPALARVAPGGLRPGLPHADGPRSPPPGPATPDAR